MLRHATAETVTMLRQAQAAIPDATGLREQLDGTTRALVAADGAHLGEGFASVRWERRGPLQRLVRRPA